VDIKISIPDDLAKALAPDASSLPRAILESFALEAYRDRRLSEFQVQRLLGMSSRFAVHKFLKEHDVPLNYSMENLLEDVEMSRDFEGDGPLGSSNAA
jgi:hypothetical protein